MGNCIVNIYRNATYIGWKRGTFRIKPNLLYFTDFKEINSNKKFYKYLMKIDRILGLKYDDSA